MIERLPESNERAVGLKVTGRISAAEVDAMASQLGFTIGQRGRRKVGVLVDASGLDGVDWKARLSEIGFLRKWSDHIERVAVVGAHRWEEVMAEILAGTVLVEAETRYYDRTELAHAWHWVKTGQNPDQAPVRRLVPKDGLMAGYVPEYSEE